MKLIARFIVLIANPKKDLESFDFNELEESLKRIDSKSNKIEALIDLFQLISPFQDKNELPGLIKKLEKKNYGQLNEVVKSLKKIQLHVENAGRDRFGMNRSEKGEEVNINNVFIGGVYGLNTKPVSFWLENKEDLEKQIYLGTEKSVWYFINQHAGDFVDSHVNGILQNLKPVKSFS